MTVGSDNLLTDGAGADAFWIASGEILTETNTISDFAIDKDLIGVSGIGATSSDELELSQVGDETIVSFSGFDLAVLLDTPSTDLQANG